MQYTEIFKVVKIENFRKNNFDSFNSFAQSIGCGYTLETASHNVCFGSKVRKLGIDSSCMTNIKILPHKMADFVCVHWVNCISEYSKVKLERNYVQLSY